ncbi:MAG: RAD55 family ATPase [Thermoplasmata archaeon]
MQRLSTGIEGLDKMLYGGLVPGRSYVLTGPPGSGKSIMGMHFLLEGIKNGESVILVSVDEPPNEIKANMAHFGWGLDRLRILDATPDIRAHSKSKSIIDVGTTLDVRDMEQVSEMRKSQQRIMEVSVHSVQKMLRQEFTEHFKLTGKRYTRVVLDSLTSLKLFGMRGEDSSILIQSFMRFLSELEATIIITTDLPSRETLETEFFLARGEIRLHKWYESGMVRRAVSVEKLRGSAFDDSYRPMIIGDRGLYVQGEGEVALHGQRTDGVVESFIEDIQTEELFEAMEEVLRLWERCEAEKLNISDLRPRIYRAFIHWQMGLRNEALQQAILLLDQLRKRRQRPSPQVVSR